MHQPTSTCSSLAPIAKALLDARASMKVDSRSMADPGQPPLLGCACRGGWNAFLTSSASVSSIAGQLTTINAISGMPGSAGQAGPPGQTARRLRRRDRPAKAQGRRRHAGARGGRLTRTFLGQWHADRAAQGRWRPQDRPVKRSSGTSGKFDVNPPSASHRGIILKLTEGIVRRHESRAGGSSLWCSRPSPRAERRGRDRHFRQRRPGERTG